MKIIFVVSRDAKTSARCEHAMERGEKILRYQTPVMMAAFRPRIRKQQIDDFDRIGRKQIFDRVRTFDAEHAQVPQSKANRFCTGTTHTTAQPFDADKVALWKFLRQVHQKRAVPTAEIDFQRRCARKNLRKL